MKRATPIVTTLTIWFLLLSLVPLSIVAYYSYQHAVANIETMQRHKLEDTASSNLQFTNLWLNQTLRSLEEWSQDEAIQHLCLTLDSKFAKSNLAVHEFTKSSDYNKTIENHDKNIKKKIKNHRHIYDFFLIDLNGNILYSITKESDLGTSLIDGVYQNTKFAQAYRSTLADNKAHFSDLEYYAPSNNAVAGFITLPIKNYSEKTIGIMAIQLGLSDMMTRFDNSNNETIRHYIVGYDSLLRTPIGSKNEILSRHIRSKTFWSWYKEHVLLSGFALGMKEHAFFYRGANGKTVLGQHHPIEFLGVHWAQISEIDADELLIAPRELAYKIIIITLSTITAVVFLSIIISRRITRPIKALNDAALHYMHGDKNIAIQTTDQGEIGELASSFNQLINTIEADQSHLKRTMQTLQEQKVTLDEALRIQKTVFNNAGVAIIVTDKTGVISQLNKTALDMLGYQNDELVGKETPALFHKTDEVIQMAKELSVELGQEVQIGFDVFAIKTKLQMPNAHEWTYIRKDKSELTVYLTITALRDENQNIYGYMGIASDISLIKLAEIQMTTAKEEAENSAKAKSEFLAAMSHEIRTPMNGVLGMLELLENSNLDYTQHHQLRVAKSSANSLLALINDILDFSKIEAGKMQIEQRAFNIHDELSEFMEIMAFTAHEKGLELILDATQLHTQNIIGDSGRLRQILTNLVSNAIKFTHHGHILVRIRFQPTSTDEGDLLLDVVDTGIGIAPEKIGSLFDAFIQADGSTTRKYGGTGLGLSIVKQLCALMGGDISAKSTLGSGSTFSAYIKVKLSSEAQEEKPTQITIQNKQDNVATWPQNTRILLVEDNATNQIVALGILDILGLEADVAQNGLEALDAIRLSSNTAPYTIVLMDCQMPEMDGYTASQAIRDGAAGEENKTVPIIAMTANAMSGDREVCIAAGMSDYISKPIGIKELETMLKKWLK